MTDVWKLSFVLFLLSMLEVYLLFRCARATLCSRRISSLKPVKIGDLQESASSKTDWVAIKGTVSCPKPLKSRYLGTTCVFYLSEIFREPQSELEFSKSEGVLFDLSDETGSVLVDPRDAEVVSDQVGAFEFGLKEERRLVDSLVDPVLGKLFAQVGIPNQEIARTDLKSLPGKLDGSFRCSDTVISVGDTLFAVGQLKNVSGRLILTSSGKNQGSTLLTNLSRVSYLHSLSGQARKFLLGIVLNALVIALVVTFGVGKGLLHSPW